MVGSFKINKKITYSCRYKSLTYVNKFIFVIFIHKSLLFLYSTEYNYKFIKIV